MANVKKARVLRMLFCDFCGQSQETCGLLVQGRDQVHICDKCVSVCVDILVEHAKQEQPTLQESSQAAVAVDPQAGSTTS